MAVVRSAAIVNCFALSNAVLLKSRSQSQSPLLCSRRRFVGSARTLYSLYFPYLSTWRRAMFCVPLATGLVPSRITPDNSRFRAEIAGDQ